jgi:endonuclease YncB( thermonuclease family)
VDHVHDGDSVRLADGRALRLIGIDTPELARDGRPDEPLARAARDRLRELLRDSGMRLELRFDREREDHYGRLLAHAYLPDGRSIAAELLAEGLATQLVVPPNEASWTCFRQAERVARRARLGLWALPGYQVMASQGLDPTCAWCSMAASWRGCRVPLLPLSATSRVSRESSSKRGAG